MIGDNFLEKHFSKFDDYPSASWFLYVIVCSESSKIVKKWKKDHKKINKALKIIRVYVGNNQQLLKDWQRFLKETSEFLLSDETREVIESFIPSTH